MKRLVLILVAFAGFFAGSAPAHIAATVQTIKEPDERFKTDILVVVAHPDDEGGVTPYLARAIYDQHKRVAVVYTTRGGSGGNDYSREHGAALADIREQEARQACAKLGITNVWFLHGQDTASQNVLNSLANWGHGANLEALVRIVRLTRPEVIISWLPGIFIGENHGDHQASGVLATEAFDLASDPTVFPAQVAGASKRLEIYLENLTPWQPKKIYYFSDAHDQKQFAGSGPAYSIREISPSQKKPYWRLAMDAATPHLTQFSEDIQHLLKMSDDELNKMMSDPNAGWWPEPMTLIFGKAANGNESDYAKSIFPETEGRGETSQSANSTTVEANSAKPIAAGPVVQNGESAIPFVSLGDPWRYYNDFYWKHALRFRNLAIFKSSEIALKNGAVMTIPIVAQCRNWVDSTRLTFNVHAPEGWKMISSDEPVLLKGQCHTPAYFLLQVQAPTLTDEQLRDAKPVLITVDVDAVNEIRLQPSQRFVFRAASLRVLLKKNSLPQN